LGGSLAAYYYYYYRLGGAAISGPTNNGIYDSGAAVEQLSESSTFFKSPISITNNTGSNTTNTTEGFYILELDDCKNTAI
jgi:hypothetical protein